MAGAVAIGGIHHVTLTVSDLQRSREFYTGILGFQVAAELSPARILIANGSLVMALTLPSDQSQPVPENDRFSENRIGLDHVSFSVSSRDELERAVQVFDANGVPHGEIRDLSPYGLPILVLAFRDPDNIQLELTSPA